MKRQDSETEEQRNSEEATRESGIVVPGSWSVNADLVQSSAGFRFGSSMRRNAVIIGKLGETGTEGPRD